MNKFLCSALLLGVSCATLASNAVPVKDNGELALTLSQNNYNRILIKNDKILDFAFPKGFMGIKRDEQDGSVYVIPASNNPFTLFLITEAGRHLTVTVNAEESLGKTIELIPERETLGKSVLTQASQKSKDYPQEVVDLITHMEQHDTPQNFKLKHSSGAVQRIGQGLMLHAKESWVGDGLEGEWLEVYNASSQVLALTQSQFAQPSVRAIKLSQTTLAPKQTAQIYRVRGTAHG